LPGKWRRGRRGDGNPMSAVPSAKKNPKGGFLEKSGELGGQKIWEKKTLQKSA